MAHINKAILMKDEVEQDYAPCIDTNANADTQTTVSTGPEKSSTAVLQPPPQKNFISKFITKQLKYAYTNDIMFDAYEENSYAIMELNNQIQILPERLCKTPAGNTLNSIFRIDNRILLTINHVTFTVQRLYDDLFICHVDDAYIPLTDPVETFYCTPHIECIEMALEYIDEYFKDHGGELKKSVWYSMASACTPDSLRYLCEIVGIEHETYTDAACLQRVVAYREDICNPTSF